MNYIHPTALIGPNVVMGDNNYIGPYCIIGFPAEHKEYFHWKMNPELYGASILLPEGGVNYGRVIIGDNCVFTGHCTVDGGTESNTILRNGVWMLKHSHIGHDALIGEGCVISCGAKVGGHAFLGPRVNLGLNAVIHQRVSVPFDCMIGMGAVVTKKTPMMPQQKYAGNPAKWLGVNEVK